jgi:hypothetical protein
MYPGSLLHRVVATLLALACITPMSAVCGSAGVRDHAMAGMACCQEAAPSRSGTVEQDCCRMDERTPESIPAAPLPPRASVTSDTTPGLAAAPAPCSSDNTRAHYDLQSTRGRPHGPAFLRTSVLLI